MSDQELLDIFFPYTQERFAEYRAANIGFSHYCTASTALSIFENEELWLRSAFLMNDYSEISHGRLLLSESRSFEELKYIIKAEFPDISEKIGGLFQYANKSLSAGTYLSSFSVHDFTEDQNGKLSMWRAYGGDAGVCIVFNKGPFLGEIPNIPLYASPVAYLNRESFNLELGKIVTNIKDNLPYLKSLNPDILVKPITNMLIFALVSMKHEGFIEEQELRLVAVPHFFPADHLLQSEIRTIHGTPQKIMKLPFRNRPDLGLEGIELPDLIEKVIIGPGKHPHETAAALAEILDSKGVQDIATKIHVSEIPLRN